MVKDGPVMETSMQPCPGVKEAHRPAQRTSLPSPGPNHEKQPSAPSPQHQPGDHLGRSPAWPLPHLGHPAWDRKQIWEREGLSVRLGRKDTGSACSAGGTGQEPRGKVRGQMEPARPSPAGQTQAGPQPSAVETIAATRPLIEASSSGSVSPSGGAQQSTHSRQESPGHTVGRGEETRHR
ncbi:coiled-coil domain-containing protein 86-like isoform X2 [Lagenorhynchus albirostris]|uniref:coiled-coil domain-containing protein 86-like isoform X2 n=1 Tax=Lagenorhynchus albirostris TaxID=27610 RepID=UPI0028EDA030|nr:coiled-coil domain-containing protein 86-like isoform X2 [Lagenorhynchus albirostris]